MLIFKLWGKRAEVVVNPASIAYATPQGNSPPAVRIYFANDRAAIEIESTWDRFKAIVGAKEYDR